MSLRRNRATLLSSLLLMFASTFAFANPNEAQLIKFSQAAAGDSDLVEPLYEELNSLAKQQQVTPLTLVYLGATNTLIGRDAFWPWDKMKHAEKGLATIQKGLDLMMVEPLSVDQQNRYLGLPEYYLAMATAASTYTSMPDMFNHFERGYDLLRDLLDQPSFTQQPFVATAWIYQTAIKVALQAEDRSQAKVWLAQMEQQGSGRPETAAMQALLASEG